MPVGTGERQAQRGRHVDAVPWGDEDRPDRVRTAAPTRSPWSSSGDQAPRRSGGIANSPNSRDLATPMVGRVEQPAEMARQAEAPGVGEALAIGKQQIRGAGERRQRFEHRRDFAKRQQARPLRKCGRPARQRGLDHLQIRESAGPPTAARVTRHGPRTRRRCRRSGRARPTDRVLRPRPTGAPGEHALRPAQIPGARMDRPQRHGRRSPASLMTRTVSDHRPSDSTSATLNQRASAASLPGRSAALGASATKSIRV